MRLISARIRGFGRFVDAKINVDSKVIAVVGPNEAGKTTLLKALAHIESEEPVALPQRSRAIEVADGLTVVSLEYVLDDEDREALADLDLHEAPQSMTVGRRADGGTVTVGIHPIPMKSVGPLKRASKVLNKAARAKDLDDWINPETTYADPGSDAPRDYRAELSAVIEAIDAVATDPSLEVSEDAVEKAQALQSCTLAEEETEPLRAALGAVVAWSERDPGPDARNRLWRRSPDLLLFDEADRTIQSAYTLDDALLRNVPLALGRC